MAQPAFDCAGGKKVRVERADKLQIFVAIKGIQFQVKQHRTTWNLSHLCFQPIQAESRCSSVQTEHDRHDRRTARVARKAHPRQQASVGKVLILVCIENDALERLEVVGEGRIRFAVAAHR